MMNRVSAKTTRSITGLLRLLPGPIFSLSNGFGNFIGLNISAPWVESGAAEAGRLFPFRTSQFAPGGRFEHAENALRQNVGAALLVA